MLPCTYRKTYFGQTKISLCLKGNTSIAVLYSRLLDLGKTERHEVIK